MNCKLISMLMGGAALLCAGPASAAVLGLNYGPTVQSTTLPLAPLGYTALDTAVAPATWQFVLGPGLYKVSAGGSATDSIVNDLSLAGATLKLIEISPVSTVLQTLSFADSTGVGQYWSTPASTPLNLGPGTYQLVFSGGSFWGGNSKFFDSPSFSGTVSITAAPEMSTWTMMLAGFAAFGIAGYRRRVAV